MTGHSNSRPAKTVFGARLRVAQVEAKKSNRELAQELDISESLLAKWKRGDSTPTLGNASRVAVALDKPLNFFTDDEEPVAA